MSSDEGELTDAPRKRKRKCTNTVRRVRLHMHLPSFHRSLHIDSSLTSFLGSNLAIYTDQEEKEELQAQVAQLRAELERLKAQAFGVPTEQERAGDRRCKAQMVENRRVRRALLAQTLALAPLQALLDEFALSVAAFPGFRRPFPGSNHQLPMSRSSRRAARCTSSCTCRATGGRGTRR